MSNLPFEKYNPEEIVRKYEEFYNKNTKIIK